MNKTPLHQALLALAFYTPTTSLFFSSSGPLPTLNTTSSPVNPLTCPHACNVFSLQHTSRLPSLHFLNQPQKARWTGPTSVFHCCIARSTMAWVLPMLFEQINARHKPTKNYPFQCFLWWIMEFLILRQIPMRP